MGRWAYRDGRYLRLTAPAVAIEDRGYQFADGVYEMIKVIDGRPRDLERHFDRLERSLGELRIPMPTTRRALGAIIGETLRRNRLSLATVYLQVTRGIAPRNHPFPARARPTLTVTVRRAPFPDAEERRRGVAVLSVPEQRWARCDIKSIALLPNVLARQRAAEAGCREAWFVGADGVVTEGSASNAFIVDTQGRLRTHPAGPRILSGITRGILLELARAAGIEVVEEPFTLEEAKRAREAFLSSTTSLLLPVTRIDDSIVANGVPGSLTRTLARRYAEYLEFPEAASGLS